MNDRIIHTNSLKSDYIIVLRIEHSLFVLKIDMHDLCSCNTLL